ncbi:MAG: YkgJ family cysteine cluster protein [Chloroflexi bacterium]|nr:YkgJ family cysteine cluster protein [Chloroflexota bacterium]
MRTVSKTKLARAQVFKSHDAVSLDLPSALIVDGKVNWVCLGRDCPKHCCSPNIEGWEPKGIPLFRDQGTCPLTPEDSRRIEKNHGRECIQIVDQRTYLRFRPDNSCYFWNPADGSCSSHDIRPTACRAFPLFLDKYWGPYLDPTLCPGVGAGWTDADALLEMLKGLVSMARYQLVQGENYMDQLSRALKR